MTPSELKRKVESREDESLFFSYNNMRFGGDTMRNYGVCSAKLKTWDGETVEVWQLYRRRATSKGLTGSAFFRKDTFEKVSGTIVD